MTHRSLSLVVHAHAKTGKSWLADTCPKPLLVLDAEGGSRFTPSRKVVWDGLGAPPAYDGTWDTCVVTVRQYRQVTTVFQWLNSGQHPFVSIALDSLTEIQKRCLDDVAGTDQPTQQHWGALLRHMEGLVRDFRDLTFHPIKPLEAVVLICMTSNKDGRWKPHVQGQLSTTLPYFMDVIGYLYTANDPATNALQRVMQIQPWGDVDAGDRTHVLSQRLGGAVMLDDLANGYPGGDANARVGVARLIDTIYGAAPQPAPAVVVEQDPNAQYLQQ